MKVKCEISRQVYMVEETHHAECAGINQTTTRSGRVTRAPVLLVFVCFDIHYIANYPSFFVFFWVVVVNAHSTH